MPEDPDEIEKCLRDYIPPLVRENALDVTIQIINAKGKVSQTSTSTSTSASNITVPLDDALYNIKSQGSDQTEPMGG